MGRHEKTQSFKPARLLAIVGFRADGIFTFSLQKQRSATAPSILKLLLTGSECLVSPDGTISIESAPESSKPRVSRKLSWAGAGVAVAIAVFVGVANHLGSSRESKPVTCAEPQVGELLSIDNNRLGGRLEFGGVTMQRIRAACNGKTYVVSLESATRKIVGIRFD